ncbi:MAG: hypothetical protein IH598_17795 [Bacteroidales bacterium]|nr:hypothetical protein [Bacteroidales bacterium]
MKNNRNDVMINCPIHEKTRDLLVASKRKINQTNRPVERSIYAEDVEEYANVLLNCDQHDEQKEDCRNCHLYAKLQKKYVEVYTGVKVMA